MLCFMYHTYMPAVRGANRGDQQMDITVGQNETEMRDLAVSLMKSNYKAADKAAKDRRLAQAAKHLEAAERWRERARSHGAKV